MTRKEAAASAALWIERLQLRNADIAGQRQDLHVMFAEHPSAPGLDRMRMKNQSARDGSIFCLLDGPDDDYVVADLRTAIETGLPYSWSV